MDLTPLHPKIVHLPIALAVLMPLVTGGLALAWWRQWLPRRAWFVALGLQIVMVVSAFLAMQTGEAAEDTVERVIGESVIHVHEEAAEAFLWGTVATLVLVLVAAVLRKERVARLVAGVSVLATLAVLFLGFRVGEAGGALVYQHGAANAYINPPIDGQPARQAPTRGEGHHDDDD